MDVEEHQQHEEQTEDQHVSFHKIEELESFGINKTDIVKLKSGGYHTIESVKNGVFFSFICLILTFPNQIAHSTLRKLIEVKGISEQKAQKLKDIIKANQLVPIGFQTATSRLECMKDLIMISTGVFVGLDLS
jgi:hypothetical protein